jgi:NAD(P)-dependent dehydrogenase (short-subunit alcohol dehydrogenase family)
VKDLKDKVAIVTGAGGGIGRATALEFARWGAKIVVAGRSIEKHEKTVWLIEQYGSEGLYVPTDVTRSSDVDNLVKLACQCFSSIHCAVNNAATFGEFSRIHQESEANFDNVTVTNLKGVWFWMKHQLRAMLEGGGGTIVNCASISGVVGHPGSTTYAASKHGVIGLTRSAALQYARHDIRINAICPGATDAEMLISLYGDANDREVRAAKIPLGRFARPEKIADIAVRLSSKASSYVTGQMVTADGGVTAGQSASVTEAAITADAIGVGRT